MRTTKLPAIIFVIGIIIMCFILTPVKDYDYYYLIRRHSFIFSRDVTIDYPRFMLYILVWTILCVGIYFIFNNPKAR